MPRFAHPLLLPAFLLSLCLLCPTAESKKSEKDLEKEREAEKQKHLAEEQAIKAKFEYSFNDVADHLVTVSCESKFGRSSGSGFIAKQDGKTYLFTNQHVILGAETIRFNTATGRTLRPRSVEFAASRDIARLLLDEEAGLDVAGKPAKKEPVAVFGNSEGGGVATELFGTVKTIKPDLVEVTADFVSGNSGSPVLNLKKEVIGIASYVTYSTGDEDEKMARRFCYRLTDTRWGAVNWKKYNDNYGQLYREYENLIDSIFDEATIWYENPFSRMSADDHADAGLRKWSDDHNSMISRIERTRDQRITQHDLDNTNKQIRKDMLDSAEALSKVCQDRARQMRLLSEQRELSGFLSDEFIRFAERLDYASEKIEEYGAELNEHNYFHFK